MVTREERLEELERYFAELREGARQRRLALELCHEVQRGAHIDSMPVENNRPINPHRALSLQ